MFFEKTTSGKIYSYLSLYVSFRVSYALALKPKKRSSLLCEKSKVFSKGSVSYLTKFVSILYSLRCLLSESFWTVNFKLLSELFFPWKLLIILEK